MFRGSLWLGFSKNCTGQGLKPPLSRLPHPRSFALGTPPPLVSLGAKGGEFNSRAKFEISHPSPGRGPHSQPHPPPQPKTVKGAFVGLMEWGMSCSLEN